MGKRHFLLSLLLILHLEELASAGTYECAHVMCLRVCVFVRVL